MPMTRRCIPYTPRRLELREATFALVSTAGVHLREQPSYDPAGDNSWRIIPGDVRVQDLMVTHEHYNHSHADVVASRCCNMCATAIVRTRLSSFGMHPTTGS